MKYLWVKWKKCLKLINTTKETNRCQIRKKKLSNRIKITDKTNKQSRQGRWEAASREAVHTSG